MKQFRTTTEQETLALGERLAGRLRGDETVALYGEPGAGKTIFCKGIARGLGVRELVTSPTFTICNIYEGRVPLYHYDMYRIGDVAELEEVGFFEHLGRGVSLVEWSENIASALPADALRVEIRYLPEGREVIVDEHLEL